MLNNKLSAEDFSISNLGKPEKNSPLIKEKELFVSETQKITYSADIEEISSFIKQGKELPCFEMAGPRKKIFFDSEKINCAIVTCGGLCPGINDVIRAIVYESYSRYKVKKVYGFRYGYQGMVKKNNIKPIVLDTDMVNEIHEKGGTMLGSSRGSQNKDEMVDYLQELKISVLFAIGGDGTLRGASAIAAKIKERNLDISVIGIPKTIDNDISYIEQTFGFETAVEEARAAIQSAHIESKGAENGVGLVKLMGRDSGFIAAQATLANADVNFCLIPEVPFTLKGKNGLLPLLKKRLIKRKHAVIVVAEGAGQDLIEKEQELIKERRKDASGNIRHEDIGVFLKDKIKLYFKDNGFPATIKYIDPSYIIRSKPANANDSIFCLQIGQNAVHAGMAGKTDMLISYWNHNYTHVPIKLATSSRKKIDPEERLWRTVLSMTDQ